MAILTPYRKVVFIFTQNYLYILNIVSPCLNKTYCDSNRVHNTSDWQQLDPCTLPVSQWVQSVLASLLYICWSVNHIYSFNLFKTSSSCNSLKFTKLWNFISSVFCLLLCTLVCKKIIIIFSWHETYPQMWHPVGVSLHGELGVCLPWTSNEWWEAVGRPDYLSALPAHRTKWPSPAGAPAFPGPSAGGQLWVVEVGLVSYLTVCPNPDVFPLPIHINWTLTLMFVSLTQLCLCIKSIKLQCFQPVTDCFGEVWQVATIIPIMSRNNASIMHLSISDAKRYLYCQYWDHTIN